MPNRSKKFVQSLSIKQVGATPIKTARGTMFKLGGGMFTKKQIVSSRQRYARIMYPQVAKKMTKKDFGL